MPNMRRVGAILAWLVPLTLGAVAVWAVRARRQPAACPFSQRLILDLPRPFMRRETLMELLEPAPGERMLEVGPGTGYYSLAVARRIAPNGQLDAFDLQQPMLDELMRRAAARGIISVSPTAGDAQELPYPDATFDAAYLVATLGEIPDKDRALRELRRALKPGGRLVVGEGQPDPHMVTREELLERAERAGFEFETSRGRSLGYLARFRAT